MKTWRLGTATAALALSILAATPVAADVIDDYVAAQLAAKQIPGIALLVEDGRLGLDDSLAKHFPGSPTDWQRITVRQLLTHTSGIKDNTDEFDYRKDYTDAELLAVMQQLPLEFEPGTQWSYSNSGYLILGLLTTQLAGKHWSEFQAERLFAPLGMQTTRVISESDLVPHRAAGYELDKNGKVVNQAWVAPTFNRCADGALYYLIRDLAAREKALEARAFLKTEGFASWWAPVRLANGTNYPYGFGWFLSEQRGEAVIEHGGSWQGFRAAITRYPEQRLAETASGSAREAADRQRTADRLQTVRSLHVLGIDRLSPQAIALLDDGSVRAVDARLETDQGLFTYGFRLDAQGRVVSFSAVTP